MTIRAPVSLVKNQWFDSQEVTADDLSLEQQFTQGSINGILANQVGSGALPETLLQPVIFDSLLTTGLLDGTNISVQHQPSDSSLGNQLQITLSNSMVAGQKTVKVAIIGLDFNGNLQYDTFVFKTNESQYTQKHYAFILTVLFNDFIGNSVQSFNLGGRIVISETKPYTVSRDVIMSAQDTQPSLFWRDFFVTGFANLQALLTVALPLYDISALNISTSVLQNQILAASDVTTQIGEKFLATTNNIQQVSLLLSVQNTASGQATNLVWTGDLIVSVYALQSTVDCITDIIPNLPIEFSPFNIPLAQVSFSYNTLQATGVTLDGNPQPISFVFSNTPIANNAITPNSFYVITIKRSGAATACDILIGSGANQSTNSRVTTFTGNAWVDLPNFDLWYQVYTDAVQVSDGQAYDAGQGLIIPKTIIDSSTNAPIDYALANIPFSGTSNANYTAVLSSTIQDSVPQNDQRTGDPVFTQQQFVPNVSLLNVIDLNNLETASQPLVIGMASDKNIKSVSGTPILASIHAWTFVGNTIIIKMIDDITDEQRYDQNVLALISYLTQGAFVNAQMIPDIRSIGTNPNLVYRIAKAELCSMLYGDVNGDGIIDTADLALANSLIGANLNVSPPLNSQITTDGYITTIINGYTALTEIFAPITAGAEFQIVNPATNLVLFSAMDGYLTVNPNNGSLASFESPSALFDTITNIAEMRLVILNNGNQQNNGSFQILSVDITSNHILDISKLYITVDSIQQIMRADITGDFTITAEDGYLIQNYIDKVPPFPFPMLPSSKIGTPFNVLTITIDPYTYLDPDDVPPTVINRTDDFPATIANRAKTLHKTQDIFVNDGYMQGYDFLDQPLPFNIVPQFSWEDYLVTTNGSGRFVPTIFSTQAGLTVPTCTIDGISCEVYSSPPPFDPGRIDVFIPNNLIIGEGGELLNSDLSNYKVDFEMGTIILEIPNGLYGTETTINVFDNFVSDYNGTGKTRLGFPAMHFADCTTVSTLALIDNQVNWSVAVQSFSPNTNGIDPDGYTGPIVDGKMGVAMDYATGQLTLNFTNLYEDPILRTLNTKVQITVFLKKGGFNNLPMFVGSNKVANLLGLNTIFSGAGGSGGGEIGGIIFSHDLFGTNTAQTVIGIQNNPVFAQILGTGQDGYVLTWDNTLGVYKALPPGGEAFVPGGDLSGTFSSQIVSGIQSHPVSSAAPVAGNTLVYGSGQYAPNAINLAGGTASILGVLPATNLPSLLGDVTGTVAATILAKIAALAGAAGIVHNDSTGHLSSSLIVNTDVSASAAIAGSKITPAFVAQNISTTGTLTAGVTTATALSLSVKTVTAATYTIDTSEADSFILCNRSGVITLTLPVPTIGRYLVVKDISGTAASNNITISPHAAETIDGTSSFVLNVNYGSVGIVCDGTSWWLV